MKKIIFVAILAFIYLAPAKSQTRVPFVQTLSNPNRWVDSIFKKMNRNDKIAQLFMVRAHTNLGKAYADSVGEIIRKEHLGGVVFFQGGPGRQAALTNTYQSLSKVPLMIAMDGEWGLGMRLDSTISYPYQMTLGAIQDKSLIYQMGQEVAKDFKRLGMQINFAPDLDVNNNPRNPVINYRSFGENKYNVAEKGIAYMKGMQDAGLFTTAKHFPGHGDTDVDSHYDLPQLPFTAARLDSLEMYPFKQAFADGLSGIMIAHMNIPALDNTEHLPSTLSKPIVTGILKDKLGYKGLIFSDAMGMKGVVKYFPNGEADVRGVLAGMDVLELSENSARAIKLIRKSIRHHRLNWDDIDVKVKRILAAKYWMGLNNLKPVNTENVVEDLNRAESKQLVQKLTDASLTVLKDESVIPLKNDFVRKTAIITIGPKEPSVFAQDLKKNNPNSLLFIIPKDISITELEAVKNQLNNYDQFIISIYDTRLRPQSTLDFNTDIKLFIAAMATKNTITAVFANPYSIAGLPGIEKSKALLVGYQNMVEMEHSAAKVLIGTLKASGTLPVTINAFFKYGDGLQMK
ncbi:MAG: glycoside hydrolase family 3 [Bacteroidetes bacterium]|nr:glycoside hydrolase family 3 [Bacteroidota bacterium]MBU1372811.1 glycoside hydrolase family 3 [Bacteroidota bacterium]MBU1485540.1 glycoside hydrolase family 3 [Bacteroidota bacterium]MBU1760079.1 glycoside hydrolase family 3 [Bacteroidota bacterium]MBU2045416.1 glycoside hydrolase family 3 [Bacteroidota bacterium]